MFNSAYTWAGRFLILLSIFFVHTETASAQNNRIYSASIVTESRDSVTFDIFYNYNGIQGSNVFISARMAQNGIILPKFAYRPSKLKRGRHTARITLSLLQKATQHSSSNQIIFSMYEGGKKSFHQRVFPFLKTWSGAQAVIKPVKNTVPILQNKQIATIKKPASILGTLQRQPLQSNKQETPMDKPSVMILEDGRVKMTFPDGTIHIKPALGGCGMTMISPDGTAQSILCSEAQSPTPPETPPNAIHNDWLGANNDDLLRIIKLLVAYDEASVQNYLSQEASIISPYAKMETRIKVIHTLTPRPNKN